MFNPLAKYKTICSPNTPSRRLAVVARNHIPQIREWNHVRWPSTVPPLNNYIIRKINPLRFQDLNERKEEHGKIIPFRS